MMPAAASFRAIRLLPAAAVLLLAWLCLAGPAWAHASLVSTQPVDGDVLASAPETFSLTFSEPVSPLALKLVKPDGAALPLPDFELRDATLVIRAPKDLERGTHVLSWRVTSEDGHPVGGSVVFSIGKVSAHAPVATDAVDWTVRAGLWAGRLGLYLGFFLGIGGAFSLAWLLPGAAAGRRLVAWALAVGGAGVAVSAGFQGLDALGVPVSWLAERTVWSTGLGTSFGWTVLAALAALVLAAAALAASGVPARILSAAALFGAGLALALSG
ncbi:MAG: copper resistance protein CopC, partial [Rhizobiales bacterium]|nr:copper resistance protein CopC [Hyphomicrobiales bacterium]